MEPSIITIPIDREIKFKKVDLQILPQNGYLQSPMNTVCNLSNVKYYIRIYPNGYNGKTPGWAGIILQLFKRSAINIDSDIMICFESANFQRSLAKGNKNIARLRISKTSNFFDSKFFDNGELIVKVKGTFKITLPLGIKHHFSAHWKIKESDLEALKSSNNGYLKSKRFNISSDSDIKYYIMIYPNGNKDANRGKTWVFLHFQLGSKTKIKADFNFSIDSALFSRRLTNVLEESGGRGPFLCSTEDLFDPEKGYFVDGEMTFKVAGTLMIEKENVEPTVLSCKKGVASKAYQKHRGKEFTIFVGEKPLKVHKKVLTDASPVFTAMFESSMKEVTEKKMIITDFDYEIVNAAIKLLYSDSVPTNFTFEQMLLLLQFSDKYDISLIKDLLHDYFVKHLSPINVCHIINFTTSTLCAPKLLEKCKEYILKCSKESISIPNLDILDPHLLLQIFKGTFSKNLEIDNS
uniref:BTB domain-containing protein n=1 Tax=Panagrolaimus davidi TaxID=227884 RepID=A0A914QGB7_9BILA